MARMVSTFDGLLDGSFHVWILCEILSKRWQLFYNVMAALASYAWWLADGFG